MLGAWVTWRGKSKASRRFFGTRLPICLPICTEDILINDFHESMVGQGERKGTFTESGHQPNLESIYEVFPSLLEGGSLRQAARQIRHLSHNHLKLLPLFIHGILEDFGNIIRSPKWHPLARSSRQHRADPARFFRGRL